jgi:hypothetical protein
LPGRNAYPDFNAGKSDANGYCNCYVYPDKSDADSYGYCYIYADKPDADSYGNGDRYAEANADTTAAAYAASSAYAVALAGS